MTIELTLPRGEVCSLEQGVLQNALNASQCSNYVDAIVVELPKLSVVALRCPPEWIAIKG
jgi:hypothetical protein